MQMGTGHLNASRALEQFNAGEQDPGGVDKIGWDYNLQDDPFMPNTYTLSLNAGDFVSATLVWDRILLLDSPFPNYVPGDEFLDFGFPDLNLHLRSSGGGVIKASTSTESNVEHIFAQVPSTGTYTLEVTPFISNFPFAIAWWAGPDERPAIQPGDFDEDGDVDGRDFMEWQRGNSPNPLSAGDLSDWQNNYGTSALSAVSVPEPEPSCVALLIVAAGCVRLHIQG